MRLPLLAAALALSAAPAAAQVAAPADSAARAASADSLRADSVRTAARADSLRSDSVRAAAEARRAARRAVAPDAAAGLVLLAGPEDDRIRLRQLLGAEETDGYLLRAPSTLRPLPPGEGGRVELIAPRLESVYNSAIPFTFNDGALWAGRGASAQLTAGVRATLGRVSLVLAPQLVYEQNDDYEIVPYTDAGVPRSVFASPWHTTPESLDTPTRFGDETRRFVVPGQSSLTVDLTHIALGAATENVWFGPGIRNGIVLSSHAEGVPHAFLRTARPVRTPLGDFEARVMLGWLEESDFFDFDEENDYRSLSAAAVTWRPAFDRRLTLGWSRAVYSPLEGRGDLLSHGFDFLTKVGRPNDKSPFDFTRDPAPDQVYSWFGRYVLPDDGLEAYVEFARTEAPRGLRDWLLHPNHAQGYTLGVQWARPLRSGAFRVQGELTNLEMGADQRQASHYTGFYKSRPVLQGYTNRGQIVGAAIGHGSSSQWLAADWFGRRWQAGLFVGRVRWENDAYYSARPRSQFAHDVSVWAGLRGGVTTRAVRIDVEASTGSRYNFLFQFDYDPDNFHGIDKRNHSLKLTVTPLVL